MTEICVHCGAEVELSGGVVYTLKGAMHMEQCEICGTFIPAAVFSAHINAHEAALVGRRPAERVTATTRGSLYRRIIRRLTR